MTSMGSRTEARVTATVKSKRTRSTYADLPLMQNSIEHLLRSLFSIIYFSKSNGFFGERIKRILK